MRRVSFALILVFLVAYPWPSSAAAPDFPPLGDAKIAKIIDGTTARLDDGRVLRLAGIDTPSRGALAARAKAALEELVAAPVVTLRSAGNPTDRQGRIVAQLFVGTLWVQGELLRRGFARVHSSADNRLGVAPMLALERQARRYHRGLWADRGFAIRSAEEAADAAGSFQLVSFTIEGVANSSGTIYLSAAADRRQSFALSLTPAAVALCREAGLDPAALDGKAVLARGFIDGTIHPTMAITHPEQIEILRRKK